MRLDGKLIREMEEWSIENSEHMSIHVDKNQYRHVIDIERCLSPLSDRPSTLLILNHRIHIFETFLKLWSHFRLKVCADGGANLLYELFGNDEFLRSKYLPDYIIGDLDSLKEEVAEYYRKRGVVIIRQLTQYSTDFAKCLEAIALHWKLPLFAQKTRTSNADDNHSVELYNGLAKWYGQLDNDVGSKINLLVLGGIGGRFDHTIHSISQLYRLSCDKSEFNLYCLSAYDLIFLVPPHGTLLKYSEKFKHKCIGNCGLLPLGGPTVLQETRGLKWDMCNWSTSLQEGKVSSNNRFVGENACFLRTKDSIIMNVEIRMENLDEFLS